MDLLIVISEELKMKGKEIFPAIRGILYGSFHGPDLYTIITILGKEDTIRRLKTRY